MYELSLWLRFLSILTLICSLITSSLMGVHERYFAARQHIRESKQLADQDNRFQDELERTLIAAELPEVSSMLHELRTEKTLRQHALIRMRCLVEAFPSAEGLVRQVAEIEWEINRISKWEDEIKATCWDLAVRRTEWLSDVPNELSDDHTFVGKGNTH